ncbi:putative polyphosphate/ATP-dependent NAD kinase [Leucobacter luti]|uniref:Putative polyphosphate/ATP-dependent NAD kinase n=1 Tax=Leucobacter luti TaxID=340320 RepID=A0A4R6RS33_9MICO|nr:NAD(+)/NADH kinase [Leucobacter luti]TDP89047.1 putative polyphosphate/ATP-dependent NAD kinase [Leucobacter luti]
MREGGARVGLIVNPNAGIGGEVGLGGSDGATVQAAATALGGKPRAPERAARFVRELLRLDPNVDMVTAAGLLGGDVAPAADLVAVDGGYSPAAMTASGTGTGTGTVAVSPVSPTTAADTTALAAHLASIGVEIIVFVGGDGTARDVLAGVPEGQLCLGVPAGVKMHSGVFAVTPEDAAQQVIEVLRGRARSDWQDVADLDEDARRAGVLSASVYGSMQVPQHDRMQRGKRSPAHGSGIDAVGAAAEVRLRAGRRALVFGPGTTVARVAEWFGLTSTLLGFDVGEPDGTQHLGVSGAELEQLLTGKEFSVVLSPVGGQGFVIGRGNHQLTETLLDRLDPAQLIVIAEPAKLGELAGRLRIDAPTNRLNAKFRGFCRVVLGAGEIAVARIE